jgi:hypothetical protein
MEPVITRSGLGASPRQPATPRIGSFAFKRRLSWEIVYGKPMKLRFALSALFCDRFKLPSLLFKMPAATGGISDTEPVCGRVVSPRAE